MKKKKLEAIEVDPYRHTMLNEAGMDIQRANLSETWDIFKKFLAVPIECFDEGFLFECGIHKYGSDKGAFFVHFVRYYYLEETEVIWAEMVDCNFDYDFNSELSAFEFSVGENVERKDKFIAEIDAEEQFWAEVSKHSPKQSHVYVGCQ